MLAIQARPGNPEGIELLEAGNALCLYSKTMPWASFNTVKGCEQSDQGWIERILSFYESKQRKPQWEITPGRVEAAYLAELASKGFYHSGYHTAMVVVLGNRIPNDQMSCPPGIRIESMNADQFNVYALIHCRSFGLSDEGIPPVAANNAVLYDRPGWRFYLAYVDEQPAATAAMYLHGDVASLTFSATLPAFRRRGLHQLLIQRRMEEALQEGCNMVVGQCAWLSPSQRNMERCGMQLGYLKSIWSAWT